LGCRGQEVGAGKTPRKRDGQATTGLHFGKRQLGEGRKNPHVVAGTNSGRHVSVETSTKSPRHAPTKTLRNEPDFPVGLGPRGENAPQQKNINEVVKGRSACAFKKRPLRQKNQFWGEQEKGRVGDYY